MSDAGETRSPHAFQTRMRTLLGDEAASLEAALSQPPSVGLRVNTAKLTPAAFAHLSSWPLTAIPWCPSGFTLPPEAAAHLRPGSHPFHHAGLYYLQDPSAMAAAEALAPRPGELALDLAAAPGGKATHLTSLLAGSGALIANDVHPSRVVALGQNLERWGAGNVAVSQAPAARLAERFGALFDMVLLDAPCSGEGMFRKSPEARRDWSEPAVARCALRQQELIVAAARLVRPGGRLLYSTCTFAPEENERVVAAFLQQRPDFSLRPLRLPGSVPGRPDWADGSAPLERSARYWPHLADGEGHYLALMVRREDGEPQPPRGRGNTAAAAASHRALWLAFASASLHSADLGELELVSVQDRLYGRPATMPSLAGIRTLRVGLWLGTVRKGRFEPAHSLALALDADRFANRLDLHPDDPQVSAYLQGHPLEAPGADGWLAITTAGHPLGWGKRSRGVINNAYPKGLRRG